MPLPSVVARVEITTTSSTDNLTTAAFVTSGSNRALFVLPALRNTSVTISSVSRGGSDTFASSGVSVDPSGCFVNMWASTNEPVTASTALTTTISSATTAWGVHVMVMSDVDQTTRYSGTVANADTTASDGLTSLTVASGSTNNLVMDYFCVRSNTGTPSPSGSQTDRGGWTASTLQSRVSTLPGTGGNVSMGWSTINGDFVAHMGWAVNGIAVTAPAANVTADDNPITYLDTATAVPSPPTVTEGTSSITSIVVSCDAGTITMTASGSVTISNNSTSSVTLQNGASETEYNTVLATMTHTRSTHGVTTFTIAPTDGTLSDSENFTRFVSPIGIEFSGTQAQVRALIQSLGVVMDVGETSASLVLYVEDDTSPTPLTDEQVVSLSTIGGISAGLILAIRRRRKKKSGN